jgi:hypothetical protein
MPIFVGTLSNLGWIEGRNVPTYPNEDCYIVAGTEASLAIPTTRRKRFGKE